ncbi:MAG: metallophosphoesterase [Clostridia bacterium]|nr:metallophosphoesterase [Clostridia bacterium]
MKIIHTGDVHLGSSMLALPTEKAKIRRVEIADTFRKLTVYAKESGVDAVLIAGDLFDGEKVSRAVVDETLATIRAAAPVRFFCVFGNHDGKTELGELPENLLLFPNTGRQTTYVLPERVTLTGIDGDALGGMDYQALQLPEDHYNIFVTHGEIANHTRRDQDVVCLPLLQNKNVDYLALGHIHVPTTGVERLDSRGKYRYCGCLEGRGFDECGVRGFFLLEIENGRLKDEKFLSLAKRTVQEVRVDISSCHTYFELESAALSAARSAGEENIIKLVLCGTYQENLRKDLSVLKTRLSDHAFFVKIEDCSKLRIDYEACKNDVSERGEFIREVKRYAMDESLREEILEVGLKALAGEEIDL